MTLAQELIAVAVGLMTLVGGLWALWAKKVAPALKERQRRDAERQRREQAIEHVIVGRPAILDTITGNVIADELPGIGHRMATVEQVLVDMADSRAEVAELKATQEAHGKRLDRLDAAQFERVASHIDSAAAWRAMEAATKADPDQEAGP